MLARANLRRRLPVRTLLNGSLIGLLGCYTFFFFAPFSTAGTQISLAFIVIAALLDWKRMWRHLSREPVFWLILVLTLFILARSYEALQTHPEIADQKNPHWTDFLRTSGLLAVPLGWLLYQHRRHVPYLLCLLVCGFLVGIVYATAPDTLHTISDMNRHSLGYQPNFLGFLTGGLLIAFLAFAAEGGVPARRPCWTLFLVLFALLSYCLLISASRGAWIAFFTTFLILFLHLAFSRNRYLPSGTIGNMPVIVGCLIIIGVAGASSSMILDRFAQVQNELSLLLGGSIDAAAAEGGSVGYRVAMWSEGMSAFVQRPWVGWGPSAALFLLDELPYSHFHNLYLEVAVSFGTIGLLLYAAVAGCLLVKLLQCQRRRVLPRHWTLSLLLTSIFLMISLSFTIRLGQSEGRAVLLIVTSFYVLILLTVSNPERQNL